MGNDASGFSFTIWSLTEHFVKVEPFILRLMIISPRFAAIIGSSDTMDSHLFMLFFFKTFIRMTPEKC